MPFSDSDDVRGAEELARRAEELAGKLKAGGWESVQTLALISIAKSLTVLAARSVGGGNQQQG